MTNLSTIANCFDGLYSYPYNEFIQERGDT